MILPHPSLISAQRDVRPIWSRCKRVFDVVTSAWLLVITTPIVVTAMLLVRLTSAGPAIFTQRRVGRHGLPFMIYKVRTMCLDAEAQGPRWCTPGDGRVTAVGRVLRRLHLDELPQLWNVIRGDMSLVGPRPERPEFLPKLRALVPNYNARHAVLPGITGLAQVQLDADTNITNVFRKLRYDRYYIDHAGPWLETQILTCTVLKVLGVSLPKLRAIMNLELELVAQAPKRRAA